MSPASNTPSMRGVGNGPVAGRFVLLHVGFQAGMEKPDEGYVTSWDTWEEARVAFNPERAVMPPGFKLIDGETGRVWHPGARYVWEDAQT